MGPARETILSGKRCLHSSMPSSSGTKNGPTVRLMSYDKTAAVGGINKRLILGPAIRPLGVILLILAVFNIEIKGTLGPNRREHHRGCCVPA